MPTYTYIKEKEKFNELLHHAFIEPRIENRAYDSHLRLTCLGRVDSGLTQPTRATHE